MSPARPLEVLPGGEGGFQLSTPELVAHVVRAELSPLGERLARLEERIDQRERAGDRSNRTLALVFGVVNAAAAAAAVVVSIVVSR